MLEQASFWCDCIKLTESTQKCEVYPALIMQMIIMLERDLGKESIIYCTKRDITAVCNGTFKWRQDLEHCKVKL